MNGPVGSGTSFGAQERSGKTHCRWPGEICKGLLEWTMQTRIMGDSPECYMPITSASNVQRQCQARRAVLETFPLARSKCFCPRAGRITGQQFNSLGQTSHPKLGTASGACRDRWDARASHDTTIRTWSTARDRHTLDIRTANFYSASPLSVGGPSSQRGRVVSGRMTGFRLHHEVGEER